MRLRMNSFLQNVYSNKLFVCTHCCERWFTSTKSQSSTVYVCKCCAKEIDSEINNEIFIPTMSASKIMDPFYHPNPLAMMKS